MLMDDGTLRELEVSKAADRTEILVAIQDLKLTRKKPDPKMSEDRLEVPFTLSSRGGWEDLWKVADFFSYVLFIDSL